jgi:hypothetical protein
VGKAVITLFIYHSNKVGRVEKVLSLVGVKFSKVAL